MVFAYVNLGLKLHCEMSLHEQGHQPGVQSLRCIYRSKYRNFEFNLAKPEAQTNQLFWGNCKKHGSFRHKRSNEMMFKFYSFVEFMRN